MRPPSKRASLFRHIGLAGLAGLANLLGHTVPALADSESKAVAATVNDPFEVYRPFCDGERALLTKEYWEEYRPKTEKIRKLIARKRDSILKDMDARDLAPAFAEIRAKIREQALAPPYVLDAATLPWLQEIAEKHPKLKPYLKGVSTGSRYEPRTEANAAEPLRDFTQTNCNATLIASMGGPPALTLSADMTQLHEYPLDIDGAYVQGAYVQSATHLSLTFDLMSGKRTGDTIQTRSTEFEVDVGLDEAEYLSQKLSAPCGILATRASSVSARRAPPSRSPVAGPALDLRMDLPSTPAAGASKSAGSAR